MEITKEDWRAMKEREDGVYEELWSWHRTSFKGLVDGTSRRKYPNTVYRALMFL